MNFLYPAIRVLLTTILSLSIASAKIVYVNTAAAPNGDGTSWATACRFLQDGLDLTDAGDEVWVAAGTYYPDDGASVTTGDRAASFTLKQDLKLYGGFVGGESERAQRNAVANVTVLSGEIWTEKLYWSLHVITLAGDAYVDGFTITRGNANGDSAPHNQGGGVYVPTSIKLNINNCSLVENAARFGGAVYSSSSFSISGMNCLFLYNSATTDGGAVYTVSSVSIESSILSNNSGGRGGAIFAETSFSVKNSSLLNNSAADGGAIYAQTPTSSSVAGCIFDSNTASSDGGAICFYNNVSSSQVPPSLVATSCLFSNNASAGTQVGRGGGAIRLHWHCSGIAVECTFAANTSASDGGAISFQGYTLSSSPNILELQYCKFVGNASNSGGGAIGFYSNSSGQMVLAANNCAFALNTAEFGGALYSYKRDSTLSATNCTFTDNLSSGSGNKGGAIHSNGRVRIFNNLLWHTLPTPQSNLIYITSTGSLRNADVDFPSPLNQAINLIKGGTAAITAETGAVVSLGDTEVKILSVDPLFVDPANPAGLDGVWGTADDGFRLQATSPAIDLGLSMFLPADRYDLDRDEDLAELIPVDLAGYDRIQRAALDLGAYEMGDSYQPVGIRVEPLDLTLLKFLETTFTVTASGYGLKYQWYRGVSGDASEPIAGATGNSYTTPELESTASYWVRVANAQGFADSRTATATVVPIIITAQPANTLAPIGGTASLSVTGSGKGLTYQWYQGASGDTSQPVEGANQAGFTTTPLAETGSYWVRLMNVYGTLDSDTAVVTVVADPVAAALNKDSNLVLSPGGNAPWFAQSATTRDGVAAAQSGAITHSQSSTVQATVDGPGTISFWWRVSSQSGGDFLRFYINDVEQSGSISGTTGTWAQKSFTVTTAGAHTFKWSYAKNSSTSSGSDCGWVDEVVWSPKLITTQPAAQNILSGMSAGLSVSASGTNLSYQWFVGESGVTTSPVTGATGPVLTTPALSDTTKYWVKVGNGAGFESSITATVTVSTPDSAIANALNSGNAVSYFTWGGMPWIAQSSTTHDGVSAMQSGAIGHSQTSVLEGVVDGNGTLRFWWKVCTPKETYPGRFENGIFSKKGEMVGEWTAHICKDAHELCRHLSLSSDQIALIGEILPDIWPLAYLNTIMVSEVHRDSKFGSEGLADFLAKAVSYNCRIALVRIGWSEDSPMAKNLHFYRRNGWKYLFKLDSNGIPDSLPLAFHDLSASSSSPNALSL